LRRFAVSAIALFLPSLWAAVSCGVAALTFAHVQRRDGRWRIVDLRGKHGRVRTTPMPTWVKVAIDAWTSAGGVVEGYVFRPVSRADRVAGDRLGEKVVWQMLREYAAGLGKP
jgi:integrase